MFGTHHQLEQSFKNRKKSLKVTHNSLYIYNTQTKFSNITTLNNICNLQYVLPNAWNSKSRFTPIVGILIPQQSQRN